MLGTLVGLGGAFVVIPVLRLVFGLPPAETAGISLVMVLANGISGSFGYLRQGRADVRMAALTAVTGIPASILGTLLVQRVSLAGFDLLLGTMQVAFFFNIMRRRNRTDARPPKFQLRGLRERVLVDARGDIFTYSWSSPLTLAIGVVIGLATTFFGIGGGVIFALSAMTFLRMPAHVATATAILAMLLTAPVGVASHVVAGDVNWLYAAPLAAGGILGGQFGPKIAQRLTAPQLLTVLAYAMLGAALALALKHLL
ncbi:MAG: sulfite exporter TauE/SafE family protein, partial [Candidatus Eremiobacteraeota bacterium]|nr:sulfite exporter TauE/SafE family protein [Candidatus Eremiobacteraeota bacterium]